MTHTYKHSALPLLTLSLCCLALTGCPDDTSEPIKQPRPSVDLGDTNDMSVDMVKDQSSDMAPDQSLDMTPSDTSADLPPSDMSDSSPDDMAVDMPAGGDMTDMTQGTTLLRGVCDPRIRYAQLTSRDIVNAQPTVVASGASVNGQRYTFSFLEGPVWLADSGRLLWSDFNNDSDLAKDNNGPPSIIFSYTPGGRVSVFSAPGVNRTNGLAVDQKGDIIAADHGERGITRIDPATAMKTVLAKDIQGSVFNTTNDLVVAMDGTIYFSDPAYGGPLDGRRRALTYEGVFKLTPSGQVSLLTDKLTRPNGLTLSPNEDTLYIADAGAGKVYKASVTQTGDIGRTSVFADNVAVDGMAIDCVGNLYFAVPNSGVAVFRPDGTRVGLIPNTSAVTNIAFGGADRQTLFVTERQTLKSVKLPIPGMPY